MKEQETAKEKIALDAYSYVLELGVKKFSLSAYLRENSIPKGRFYYYFKSKDDFLNEIFKLTILKEVEKQSHNFKKSYSFEDKLKSIFYIFYSEDEDDKKISNLLTDMFFIYSNTQNEELKKQIKEFYKFRFNAISKIIKEGIKSGELKPVAKKFTKSIISTVDGMINLSKFIENFNIQKEINKYIDNLCEVLKSE